MHMEHDITFSLLSWQGAASLLQIIWIDIILSGDNAVIIALACRSLPPSQKRLGLILGTGAAVILRILFALIITHVMGVPGLKFIGGLLLLWIGVKLTGKEDEHTDPTITSSPHLWGAISTIAIADTIMSLDNVLALAAASKGHITLFIIGLALSIPLIMAGSTLIMRLLQRWAFLVWVGAGLLGWIAGELIASDAWLIGVFDTFPYSSMVLAASGALFVCSTGYLLRRMR